jgi:LysR family hydrogen peroxide-inducible transcriptional activator
MKGKLILTDPGYIFYEQSCNILKNVEDAKRRVSDFDSSSGGSVNIVILPTLAPFILPGTWVALSKNFP